MTDINQQITTKYNKTIQQELFALPIAPKKVASIYGLNLYSSDSLKNKYINSMYNISKIKPIATDIERLVNANRIVPGWISKNLLKLALFKTFGKREQSGILGFFTPTTNQIFILVDNNIKWGFGKDQLLAQLMIHEMMHMASHKFKNSFISTFFKELINYYKAMFKHIFKTSDNIDNECKLIIRFLFKKFEYGNHDSKSLEKYLKLVSHNFRSKSSMSEDEFNSTLTDFYHYIKLYFKDMKSLFNQLKNFQHIYSGMHQGYIQGLGVKNNMSFCSQELFYPSEVIAMHVELSKQSISKHFSIIKKL